jgi:hypothetical protein
LRPRARRRRKTGASKIPGDPVTGNRIAPDFLAGFGFEPRDSVHGLQEDYDTRDGQLGFEVGCPTPVLVLSCQSGPAAIMADRASGQDCQGKPLCVSRIRHRGSRPGHLRVSRCGERYLRAPFICERHLSVILHRPQNELN